MDCMRGVCAHLRNRGSHRTARTEANIQEQESNGNKRTDTQESIVNGEAHGNEPSGLRKFFGSLLSVRSRTSNQAFHFENETVKEENDRRIEENIHEQDGGQQSFEYSRKDTAVVIENVDANDSNAPGVFYDTEAADIVPYVVAEERMEEDELAENVDEETELSDNDNEIGDTDIYPYPQTTRTVNGNQRMSEDSEIEVILSTNIPDDNSKQFRQNEVRSFGTESSRLRKKSSDTSSGDVSVDQATVVHDISNENTIQGDIDAESNEIYVSRNIPVETTEETMDLDINGRNSEGESKTGSDSGSDSTEEVYQESDGNQANVNTEDFTGSNDSLEEEKEISGEKEEDEIKEGIENGEVELEGMLEEKVYSSNEKLPKSENIHDDAEISESEDIRSNPVDEEKAKETELGLIEKEERSHSGSSDSDQLVDADDDLSQGASHGDGELESLEKNNNQKEGSENDSNQSESSENESDQPEGTDSQSEAEGEYEIQNTASQESLPTLSYMKNDIQVTIIGEIEEGIEEDNEDKIDSLSKPKDVDTPSISPETNKYKLI